MNNALARSRTRKTFLTLGNGPEGNHDSGGPGITSPLATAYLRLDFSA